MKTLLLCFLTLVSVSAFASSAQMDLFQEVFINNGSFPVSHPELGKMTIGKLLATSLYPDSHLEAPEFKCTKTTAGKNCYVSWLSGRYKALTEAEAKGIPQSVRNMGAPFVQTNDCARGLNVKIANGKVISAEIKLEMCGGFSDI